MKMLRSIIEFIKHQIWPWLIQVQGLYVILLLINRIRFYCVQFFSANAALSKVVYKGSRLLQQLEVWFKQKDKEMKSSHALLCVARRLASVHNNRIFLSSVSSQKSHPTRMQKNELSLTTSLCQYMHTHDMHMFKMQQPEICSPLKKNWNYLTPVRKIIRFLWVLGLIGY